MTKEIVVITRDLSTYVGESYTSDNTSPVVFRCDPNCNMQDFDELDKVKQSHHLKNEDIERWWINNKEE